MSADASLRNMLENSASEIMRAAVAEYSGTLRAKRSGVRLPLLLEAHDDEHGARAPAAERLQDVEAADGAARRDPRGELPFVHLEVGALGARAVDRKIRDSPDYAAGDAARWPWGPRRRARRRTRRGRARSVRAPPRRGRATRRPRAGASPPSRRAPRSTRDPDRAARARRMASCESDHERAPRAAR